MMVKLCGHSPLVREGDVTYNTSVRACIQAINCADFYSFLENVFFLNSEYYNEI
jgi:hypothetical protein